MKNITSNKVRSMFLLGGVAAMMGATMMVPQPAHADKAQTLKYGAAALGILGAVLAVKGKTLPAVIAGAGAYYAYKKGQDAKEEERNENRYNGYYRNGDHRYGNYDSNDYYGRNDYNDRYDYKDNRYDSNSSNNYYGNRYDDSNRYQNDYRNDRYNNRSYSVR